MWLEKSTHNPHLDLDNPLRPLQKSAFQTYAAASGPWVRGSWHSKGIWTHKLEAEWIPVTTDLTMPPVLSGSFCCADARLRINHPLNDTKRMGGIKHQHMAGLWIYGIVLPTLYGKHDSRAQLKGALFSHIPVTCQAAKTTRSKRTPSLDVRKPVRHEAMKMGSKWAMTGYTLLDWFNMRNLHYLIWLVVWNIFFPIYWE